MIKSASLVHCWCMCICVCYCVVTAKIYLLISRHKQANTIYFIEMEIITQSECLCFKKVDIRKRIENRHMCIIA